MCREIDLNFESYRNRRTHVSLINCEVYLDQIRHSNKKLFRMMLYTLR
jgi:hypothetical protein